MTGNLSKKLTTDFLWYLAGALVPAMVSIIRLPLFTRYFSPVDFGYYSLASITFSYLSIALYSWITSCIWRYYTAYRNMNRLSVLYSNLAFLFLTATLLIIAVAGIWLLFTRNELMMKLVFSTMLFIVVNQLVSFMLVVYRIKKMAFRYNVLFSLQALLSFGLALFLIFSKGMGIEAIPVAQASVACALLLYLAVLHAGKIFRLSLRAVSLLVLKKLTAYGSVGLASGIGILLLSSSDRYIIALFDGMSSVGIYNQVYQLGQVSVYFLVTVFFNTVNPSLVRIFTDQNDRKDRIATNYVRLLFIVLLPVTVYLSLFARQLSEAMLGPGFREGYPMIPFIMFGSFVYGITLFSETRLKFLGAYSQVLVSIAIACVMNAGLNFLLIPVAGYEAAAWTTLTAYLLLFMLMYRHDKVKYLKGVLRWSGFNGIIVLLTLQVAADLTIRNLLHCSINLGWTIMEACLYAAMYVFLMRRYFI